MTSPHISARIAAMTRGFIVMAVVVASALSTLAQDASSGSAVRRRGDDPRAVGRPGADNVTPRMQAHFEETPVSDADLQWMRVIYRTIDLTKDANAPLYFPDEPIDGQENLFRIIMHRLANGQLAAYEYLDGREVFTDEYRIKVADLLNKFYIPFENAKGSTDKHPKYVIEDIDIPSNEVLSYYIVERWEFDRRTNKMRSRIEAICPVLHRAGDFGGEPVRYPMFWLKFDDLRPFMTTQTIFIDDDNNLPTCTYDDYFQLALYQGDIYKTRNLRNQSLMQLYPDPDDLKRAQDSIQRRLDSYGDNMWVPSLEELAQARAKRDGAEVAAPEAAPGADGSEAVAPETATPEVDAPARSTRTTRGTRAKTAKPKTPKVKRPKTTKPKTSSPAGGTTRSVRDRRR